MGCLHKGQQLLIPPNTITNHLVILKRISAPLSPQYAIGEDWTIQEVNIQIPCYTIDSAPTERMNILLHSNYMEASLWTF